jgi:hypothetical protein
VVPPPAVVFFFVVLLVGPHFYLVRHNPMPDELYEDMDALPGVTILHDGNADDW